jgi:2-hydroxy-3-oxopropionate reductase
MVPNPRSLLGRWHRIAERCGVPERVGFVGLGSMGGPMASNLMEAGYDLVLYNRTREKAEKLAAGGGGEVAGTPRDVAQRCDIVITMLPGPSEVEAVVSGGAGLLEGTRKSLLVVDMSTSSPTLARKLTRTARERGASMLDAPVSGGDVGAIEGTLSIMVGGDEGDFEHARPLFEVMGNTVIHVGPDGAGQVVKAANQIVVALVMEAVSEALVLGAKAQVDPEKLLDVLSGGLAGNRVMEVKREKYLSRHFEPGGKVKYHHKDLGIALAAGREYGAALPATALVDQMFGALVAQGRGGWDHSALVTLVEDWSRRDAHGHIWE